MSDSSSRPAGPHASFNARLDDGAVVVVDQGGGRSVTNDAEWVVERLRRQGFDLRLPVIYRDSLGGWDVLVVVDGHFRGFAPLGGAVTYAEARAALKAGAECEGGEPAQAARAAVRRLREG